MSPTNPLDPSLVTELEGLARSLGCELWLVEKKGNVLRLVLDREEGSVTVDDCATVSRQASALLDVADFGQSRYVLEVSSPGLDRPLLRPRDWERFTGSLAKVTFRPDGGEAKRTVTGRIEAFASGNGVVTLVTGDNEERLEVPLKTVHRARLEVEL